jgi:endonuclease YncB( thermonuclease family)
MGRQTPAAITAALLALALTGPASADTCSVISVHDGDTLTALCDGKKIKVRLTEIDAPERTQPYSRISTNSLKSLCVDQPANNFLFFRIQYRFCKG